MHYEWKIQNPQWILNINSRWKSRGREHFAPPSPLRISNFPRTLPNLHVFPLRTLVLSSEFHLRRFTHDPFVPFGPLNSSISGAEEFAVQVDGVTFLVPPGSVVQDRTVGRTVVVVSVLGREALAVLGAHDVTWQREKCCLMCFLLGFGWPTSCFGVTQHAAV